MGVELAGRTGQFIDRPLEKPLTANDLKVRDSAPRAAGFPDGRPGERQGWLRRDFGRGKLCPKFTVTFRAAAAKVRAW
jgi:hypothetical protein